MEGSDKGTAYSFLAAKDFIEKDERFLFLCSDEFPFRENIDACLMHPLSILVFKSKTPETGGVVEVDDDDFIINIEEKPEKPKTNLVADGLMALDGSIFRYEPFTNTKGEYYLTSIVAQFIKDQKVKAVCAKKFVGDITTPADLERVEKILAAE